MGRRWLDVRNYKIKLHICIATFYRKLITSVDAFPAFYIYLTDKCKKLLKLYTANLRIIIDHRLTPKTTFFLDLLNLDESKKTTRNTISCVKMNERKENQFSNKLAVTT